MATEAQILANQNNAQLSSGPVTPKGKDRSSHNAVKTGLTGQTVLLPSDSVAAYQSHIERIHKQWEPATDEERTLVQAIADTEWRLLRIPSLEAGILAVGRRKLADLYPNESDPATRAAFIEAEVQLAFRKDLSNLALQETRLRRHRHVDSEKLASLQAVRQKAQDARKDMRHAIRLYENAAKSGNTFVPLSIWVRIFARRIGGAHGTGTLQSQYDRPGLQPFPSGLRESVCALRPGAKQNQGGLAW